MNTAITKWASVIALVLIGATVAAGSIYVAEIDDAPGAALFGCLFTLLTWRIAFKTARSGQ